jgi:hypothetical protein
MKDIKSYVIGFLTCACMFLIMGQTKSEEKMLWNVEDIALEMNVSDGTIKIGNEYGRYQAFSAEGLSYMIETNTGFKYRFNPITKKWIKQSKEGEIFKY